MRTTITLLLLVISYCLNGQTNTFPSSGNVGVGTISPGAKLYVISNTGSPGDFNGYPGYIVGGYWPNGIIPETIIEHPNSSTSIGGQYTYRGGLGLGQGVGIYSVNPNPAGSIYYGDIRFHTTYWNGSGYVNADRMIIDQAGNVGIGTVSPGSKLDVNGSGNFQGVITSTLGGNNVIFSNTSVGSGYSYGRIYGASSSMIWGVEASTTAHVFNETSNNASIIGNISNTPFQFATNATVRATIDASGNVGIGTTNPTEKLSVNGNIKARKLIVTQNNWPDYVLKPGYKLKPLFEVERFIKQKNHLPDIPSEKEVLEKGVNVGENQTLLLKKIEELTLYIIDQQKQINELKKQINKK